MVANAGLCSAQPPEVLFSQLSARAIEAVCLLMVASFDLETLMSIVLRCLLNGTYNRSLRRCARMDEAAGFPNWKLTGRSCVSEPMKTTLRLPFWFLAKRTLRRFDIAAVDRRGQVGKAAQIAFDPFAGGIFAI